MWNEDYWARKRARTSEQRHAIQEARKRKPVKCANCGRKETKLELKERGTKHANDEPRLYCSRKCQQAAWEKENGAQRKREYRARQKNVPTVVAGGPASGQKESVPTVCDTSTASGQIHVPAVSHGGTASGQVPSAAHTAPPADEKLSAAINNWKASAEWLLRKRTP